MMDARGHCIVIIEESSLSRNVLAKALHAWGWEVRLVDSERAAMTAACGASGMTVVLVDWLAECVDCEELCRTIRQTPALERVNALWSPFRAAWPEPSVAVSLAGALDCVRRRHSLDELRHRLDIAAKLLGVTAPSGA